MGGITLSQHDRLQIRAPQRQPPPSSAVAPSDGGHPSVLLIGPPDDRLPQPSGTAALPPAGLPAVIVAMLRPAFYPHPVHAPVELEETHISYVLLTGDYAYKVKKPVNLGFLDFTTLERRRHFCEEELRLNRRLCPDLYLDVLPIRADCAGGYTLGGDGGSIVEYTLRMRQFPREMLFSRLFEHGELGTSHLRALGATVARLHAGAYTDPRVQAYGAPEAIRDVAEDNYRASRPYIGRVQTQAQYDQTLAFTDDFLDRHASWLRQRQAEGYIRECHGDLHLNNVCWFGGNAQVFDCIEFNEAFRAIDTCYDIAFMFMDLTFRGRRDLAYSFLNAYLEGSGDYWGTVLLPLYGSMRAYVRAKIEAWRTDDPHLPRTIRQETEQAAAAYYRVAWEFARPRQGQIVAMSGLSGSGKTTLARYLAEQAGAIHIRSDAIRKRIGKLALEQRGTADLYTSEMTARTYARLQELGSFLARNGQTVVLDAKYDREMPRRALISEAAVNRIPLRILRCEAPMSLLAERLANRAADISDATPDLLGAQVAADEPFRADELAYVTRVDTSADWQRQLSELAHGMNAEARRRTPAAYGYS